MNKILEPMSEAYLWIVNQDFESTKDAERINRSLRHLAMLDNADWQPPTILFLSKFSQEPGRVASFLSAMDTLAYGMFILRHNVNKRIGRYADLIRWIDSDDDVLGSDSPVHLSDSEDQAVLQQLDGPSTRSSGSACPFCYGWMKQFQTVRRLMIIALYRSSMSCHRTQQRTANGWSCFRQGNARCLDRPTCELGAVVARQEFSGPKLCVRPQEGGILCAKWTSPFASPLKFSMPTAGHRTILRHDRRCCWRHAEKSGTCAHRLNLNNVSQQL